MSSFTNAFAIFSTNYSAILAQSKQLAGSTWAEAFKQLDNGKLAILLIFGAALVTAVGVAVSGMIRAYHAAPDDSEEFAAQIAELEKRVDKLERMQISGRE